MHRRVLVLAVAAVLCLSSCGGGARTGTTAGTAVPPASTTGPAAPSTPASPATAPVTSAGIFTGPTANAPAGRPRGVVLLLHGGAWVASTDQVLRLTDQGTEAYRAAGFATDVVRLGTGRGAIDSAVGAYDAMHRRFGAGTPICAIGSSSGGHVALMLAIARQDLSCVVVNAAPTDLAQWSSEVPGAAPAIRAVFGDDTRGLSPARRSGEIRPPVLLQYARTDPAVPPAEGRTFLRAHPRRTRLELLDPGGAFFVHSGVDPAELAQVVPRQLRFVEDAARTAGR